MNEINTNPLPFVVSVEMKERLKTVGVRQHDFFSMWLATPKYLRHHDGGGRVSGQGLQVRYCPAVTEDGQLSMQPGMWRVGYGKNLKDMTQAANLGDALGQQIIRQRNKRNARIDKASYDKAQLERMAAIANDKNEPEERRERAFRAMVYYEAKLAESAQKLAAVDLLDVEDCL